MGCSVALSLLAPIPIPAQCKVNWQDSMGHPNMFAPVEEGPCLCRATWEACGLQNCVAHS